MIKALRLACLFGLFAALVSPVAATVPLPQAVQSGPAWQLIGNGDMRFLGWRIYEAALWRRTVVDAAPAQALAIRYARTISSDRLVSSTLDELARLGATRPERWRDALARAFPDVKAGDVLVAVREASGVRFYHLGRETAAVVGEDFADAFFGIWLDPRTREPELRAGLLGDAAR